MDWACHQTDERCLTGLLELSRRIVVPLLVRLACLLRGIERLVRDMRDIKIIRPLIDAIAPDAAACIGRVALTNREIDIAR